MAPDSRRIFGWLPIFTLLLAWPLALLTPTSTAEERKFVVLLIDFPKDGAHPGTFPNPDEVWDCYFDKSKNAEAGQPGPRFDSFAEWWEEVSYGDVTVSGNVFGWVQLPWRTRPAGVANDNNEAVIPHVELQGNSSYFAGLGENFNVTDTKFKIDMDGQGEDPFNGNYGAGRHPHPGMGGITYPFAMFHTTPPIPPDDYGYPVWAPGERFLDLNANGIYEAGVCEYWVDKNGDGKVGAKASDFYQLFGANVFYPDQDDNPDNDDDPPTFTSWINESAEWFDSNGDGQWGVDQLVYFDMVLSMPRQSGGQANYAVYRGDWGGTEIWIDRGVTPGDPGNYEVGDRAQPEEGDQPATMWEYIIQVNNPEEEGTEYFDEQWNDNFDFPEPFEDFLRRWDAGSHSFVRIDNPGQSDYNLRFKYIIDNYPADASAGYVDELIARTGNGRYDSPDSWNNNGAANSSNKMQRVRSLLADATEQTEQRRRSNRTTPKPGNYNDRPWFEECWQDRYGTTAPPWETQIPYLRKFDPGTPIPQRASDSEAPAMPFEPDRGGPHMALGNPDFYGWKPGTEGRYTAGDGTVRPNPADAADGWYDAEREYDDMPSSIYHMGGDEDIGEVMSPENEATWGHDIGANNPSAPPLPDSRIPASGPLAYNVHGDGGWDAGNQLNIEYLSWRTDGQSSTDRAEEFDFDGDGVIDFVYQYYHRDINLDGLIDLGETPGNPGEFGLPPGGAGRPSQSNYCVDTNPGTRITGANTEYPFSRWRAIEDAVEALDDSVDWDDFLGGPPPFGNLISGTMIISTRTPGDTFEPPASSLGYPIRTRDVVDPSVAGLDHFVPIGFWDGMGISLNDGSAQESVDPFSDNVNYAMRWSQHEYGHIWEGWPDLYDYDVIEDDEDNIINNPVGDWDIMAWGGSVHPTPILKADSGWLTSTDITAALMPAGETTINFPAWEFNRDRTVYVYENPSAPGEEFWFWRNSPGVRNTAGNVTRQAFDIRQPGYGLLIMHVDRTGNPEGLPQQQRIGTHFIYQMIQADGLQQLENFENSGDAGDPWPGSTLAQTWNRDTDPNNRWYNGQGSGLAITAIKQNMNSTDVTFRWSPQELPTFSWVQPPGGVSVNGVYQLRYHAYDQYGGTTIEFYAHRVVPGQEPIYQPDYDLGDKTKSPGAVDGVYAADISRLDDGTYMFYAKLVPGEGADTNVENSWSIPRARLDNAGDGSLEVLGVDPAISRLEAWTVTCVNPTPPNAETWSVVGYYSGTQAGQPVTGVAYNTDSVIAPGNVSRQALTFKISAGTVPFQAGDQFTFLTTGLTPHSMAILVHEGEVVEPAAPTAVATLESGQSGGLAPLVAVFKHAGSSDPHGAALKYTWDFGDNSPLYTTSNPDEAVLHEFTIPSTRPYTVTLTVENSFGLSDIDTVQIVVNEASAPTVRATAEPIEGMRPLRVQFRGDLTTDPQGAEMDFVWDFGDDSAPVTTRNAEHIYAEAGIYRTTLTVTNRPYNKAAVVTIEIRVTGPAADQPPVAAITIDRRFGPPPLLVMFDASDSFDPEQLPLEYAWDFGDRTPIVRGASIVEHEFAAVGVYNVKLTVTDKSSQTDSAAIVVVVTGDPNSANQSPVARILASGKQGAAPFTVTFDASSSTDPEGGLLSYAWDFGDGSDQELGPVVAHTYTTPREYSVVLVVSDAKGATGAATTKISVTSAAGDDSGQDVPDTTNQSPQTFGCGFFGFFTLSLTLVGLCGLRRYGRRLYR